MDEQERVAITSICQERGVDAVDVRVRGAVLIVEPRAGTVLPSVEALRDLASVLSERGHRYVTVDLAGWAVPGGES